MNKSIDQAKLAEFMNDSWSWHKCGSGSGGSGEEDNVYILVDEAGNEYSAYYANEKVDLNATANDIRIGTVALNDDGVVTGTKEIPSYHTTEGAVAIPVGSAFTIPLPPNKCEYTKLQALICKFNSSFDDSVATDRVVVEDSVYSVDSIDVIATVTVDVDNSQVVLGITNEGSVPYIIRYFTYKEEY